MGQVVAAYGVFAGTFLGVACLKSVIDEALKTFGKKPERPPPPPPDRFYISQDDLIRNAQEKLKMDVRNDYNYALCGPRDTGKSSFINCIRELDDPRDSVRNHEKEKAAPVGITETTDTVLPYTFSPMCLGLQHVVLWDMPGSGTVNHPSKSYFNDKVLYAFDCLLITSQSGSFGEEQIRIMNEAQKYGTPVVLLITKMEHAVDTEVKAQFKKQRNYHPTLDEYSSIVKQIIEKLKSYAQSQQNIVPRSRIFVISAHKFRDYLKSTNALNWVDADEDQLLSGEMGELIQLLTDEASSRRN